MHTNDLSGLLESSSDSSFDLFDEREQKRWKTSVKFWGCIQHYPKRELNKFYLFIFDSVLAADFVSIVQGYTDFFNLKIIFVF